MQGFTDHDEDVALGDVICRAGSGLSGSEATQKLGFSVDGSEISGALADDTLNEADLAAGRYDAASVEVWLVGLERACAARAAGARARSARSGARARPSPRNCAGMSERLSQDSGRLYTATCAADLGDARCTRRSRPIRRFAAAARSAPLEATSSFTASGLGLPSPMAGSRAGKLTFTSGANAGLRVEVKRHRKDAAPSRFELWQAMPEPIAAGDTFIVTAGCDKRFATCRDRFANVLNFRGFPHIPGNDFVISYPLPGAAGQRRRRACQS